MHPKNVVEPLPPLPSLSELEQTAAAEEVAPTAQQAAGGALPVGSSRRVEVVTLTDEEFAATLSGTMSTAHEGLTVPQAAENAVVFAAGGASSEKNTSEPPPSPAMPPAEPSLLGEEQLRCYAAAAALRYTYRLDMLAPLSLGGALGDHPLLPYRDLRGADCEAVFAYLSGRSEIVRDARGLARWALRDDERRKALKDLIEGGAVSAAIDLARGDAAAESRLSAQAKAKGEATPEETEAETRDGASRIEEILWKYLSGQAPPLEQQDSRELLLSKKVISWLHDLTPELQVPSPEKVERQLARETLLQPFRHLTGEWKDGVFVSYFKGREEELKHLYDYLDVIPPASFRDRLSRSLSNFLGTAWSFITGYAANRPLLIHGPGGVGKSTLLAKFLLDHLTEVPPNDRFPYAYLDFDVSALNVGEPVTLVAEAARQLAAQYPALRPEWEAARADWLKAISASWPEELTPEQRVEALRRFAGLLNKCENEDTRVAEQFERGLPFLLVMDTFEEVQYHDRDAVRHVFRFLNECREHVPRLCVILMGRAPLKDVRDEYAALEGVAVESDVFGTGAATDFDVTEVQLGDLATSKAKEYLVEQGVTDSELAEDLIEVVGGNPLSLRLIARVLREGEAEGKSKGKGNLVSLREEMNWRPKWYSGAFMKKVPPKALLQGVLFRRILGHIHNEKIRDLAHPGLILRRITPDLIKEVLAGPCGLGTLDDQQAAGYFDGLAKEVSLVGTDTDAEGAGALKHRVELRRIMLKLMEADETKQEQIRQVHENAARYYSKREGQTARIEALYHRLMLGDLPRPDGLLDDVPTEEAVEAGYAAAPRPDDDPRPVWRAVAEASGELPAAANTYLAARLHQELVADAAWETADVNDWELSILSRCSRRAREHTSVVSALEALRRDWTKLEKSSRRGRHRSPLPLLEVALLERLGRYDELLKGVVIAHKELRPALKSAAPAGEHLITRRLAEFSLLSARAAARTGDTRYGIELKLALTRAGEISDLKNGAHSAMARRCLRQLLRFAADCHLLKPSAEALDCMSKGLFLLLDTPEGLGGTPTLARYVVSTIHAEASETLVPDPSQQPVLSWADNPALLSTLLSRLPRPTVTRVAEALANWTQEVLRTREGLKLLEALGQPLIPREPFAMRRYWSGHLLGSSPEEVARMFISLNGVAPISEVRLTDLFRALTPERRSSGEDPFEEARRGGDLIPGEGASAAPKESARKARKKS